MSNRSTANSRALAIGVVLSLGLAAPAHANIPTSVLFPEAIHAVAGNLVIGYIEGLVVGRVLGVRVRTAVGWMLAANYFSALVGLVLLNVGLGPLRDALLGPNPLRGAAIATVGMALLLFALTTLLEWPFCWFYLRDRKPSFRVSLLASLLAQSISYPLLVPYYLVSSQFSLYRYFRVRDSPAALKPPAGWVYYAAPDRQVHRLRLDGTADQRVCAFPAWSGNDWLYLRKNANGRAELWTRRDSDNWSEDGTSSRTHPDQGKVLVSGLSGAIGHNLRKNSFGGMNYYWLDLGDTVDLRPRGTGRFDVTTDIFTWYGLMAKPRGTPSNPRTDLHLALETPFISWQSRCPSILAGGLVVYQLGDQVVLADLPGKRIAFLARGTGPAVILDVNPNSGSTYLPSAASTASTSRR